MNDCTPKEESLPLAAVSKMSARKKIVEISVGPGQFSDPVYSFFDAKGGLIKNFKINPKKTYRFSRLDGATSHPFYISDRGYSAKASSGLKFKGDGKFDQGISGDQSFTLSFKKKARRSLSKKGELSFYCTSHSSMLDAFEVKSGKRQKKAIVEPLTDEDTSQIAGLSSQVPLDQVGIMSSISSSETATIIDVDQVFA